jgi:hypothetical protein
MSQKKPPPTVVLEPAFVRDHQRRLRLVIDLLEQEAHRQHASPTNFDHDHNLNPGGSSQPRRANLEGCYENRRPVCSCVEHQATTQ